MPRIYIASIEKLLKSRKKIVINQKMLTALGFKDCREFATALGNWAYSNDFTYQDKLYDPQEGASWQRFLTAFLKYLITE